ncbi:autotransporter outer membrane beta-barrel domain-containing protein [Neisseria sp. Ec49-e6-T10]|uniref:autotransporter outer membrane beta-barrel domain-containing protein n=1 Tax=Neisseria sp. Ec49-e6-T10 TaxID=3140744 RepID=UPI003EC067D6
MGAFTNYDALKSNHAWTTGLFGAIKLAPQWSIGLSIDYLVDSSLPDGYGTRGSSNPGIGAFMRFQQNTDKTGFNVTASGAYQEQKIDIRRQKLSNTEAGVGNTKINGQLLELDLSYGVKASDKVTLFPHTGIRYTKINRDAYNEYKDAELPAYYGQLGEKNTALTLGLATEYYLSDKVTVNADAGINIKLDQTRDNFTGHIDYIGAHVYDFGAQRKNQPFVGVGIKGLVTKQSALNLQLGWTKQSYDHNTASVGLSYSYRF